MRKYVVIIILLATICQAQERKLNWGISAPLLTTSYSKELALSRKFNDNWMALCWGSLRYDKNEDITPNQDLFENQKYGIEAELRRNIGEKRVITPYIGCSLFGSYNKEYEKNLIFWSTDNEFIEEIKRERNVGLALSFGTEYFIKPAFSIFIHTRLLTIYHSWHRDANIESMSGEREISKHESNNIKGFERTTLFIRLYF